MHEKGQLVPLLRVDSVTLYLQGKERLLLSQSPFLCPGHPAVSPSGPSVGKLTQVQNQLDIRRTHPAGFCERWNEIQKGKQPFRDCVPHALFLCETLPLRSFFLLQLSFISLSSSPLFLVVHERLVGVGGPQLSLRGKDRGAWLPASTWSTALLKRKCLSHPVHCILLSVYRSLKCSLEIIIRLSYDASGISIAGNTWIKRGPS